MHVLLQASLDLFAFLAFRIKLERFRNASGFQEHGKPVSKVFERKDFDDKGCFKYFKELPY